MTLGKLINELEKLRYAHGENVQVVVIPTEEIHGRIDTGGILGYDIAEADDFCTSWGQDIIQLKFEFFE